MVLVDRANYGRLYPVMEQIAASPRLRLQTLISGTMSLARFGNASRLLERDGFAIDGRIEMELEGDSPSTMARSLGLGVMGFTTELERLKPDIVVLIGDRYEAFSAAISAAYLNMCIVHFQGGEVSGSIDESARHAITKLAHYHVPATERAKEFLLRMGERSETILGVGCPSADIASKLEPGELNVGRESMKANVPFSLDRPYVLACYHPNTTRFGREEQDFTNYVEAVLAAVHPTVFITPNIDAGSERFSKILQGLLKAPGCERVNLISNLPPLENLAVLRNASCAVGNSSSFIRDGSFFGTPIVMVGDRQNLREVADNVVFVPPKRMEISEAMHRQIARGPFPPSHLYGRSGISQQVVERLIDIELYAQKRLGYLD